MWQNGPKNRGKKIFFEKFDFKWKYFFTLMMDDGRKWVFGPSQMLIPPIMAQNGPKMAPKSLTLITKSKFTITNNFFGIIMKVAKYDMRKTCKISGRNLKKQQVAYNKNSSFLHQKKLNFSLLKVPTLPLRY